MAPAATAASKLKIAAKSAKAVTADVDLVRSYLRDIGRVPLLTHEQEITLGRQVQELMDLESLESELESKAVKSPAVTSWQRPQAFIDAAQAQVAARPSCQGADGGGQPPAGGERG